MIVSDALQTVNETRRKVALIVLIVVMTAGAVLMLAFKLRRQPMFLDYLVMWTGGRVAHVDVTALYDFAKIDRAQAWLLGPRAHDRPFPYPPSALLVFEPLARLSFWMSAWTWTLSGAALFAAGTWSLARRRRPLAVVALTCVTPGIVWAALSGQCAFVVGGLAMLAMTTLHRRPIAAGLALGFALMLKPTLLIMAPGSADLRGTLESADRRRRSLRCHPGRFDHSSRDRPLGRVAHDCATLPGGHRVGSALPHGDHRAYRAGDSVWRRGMAVGGLSWRLCAARSASGGGRCLGFAKPTPRFAWWPSSVAVCWRRPTP